MEDEGRRFDGGIEAGDASKSAPGEGPVGRGACIEIASVPPPDCVSLFCSIGTSAETRPAPQKARMHCCYATKCEPSALGEYRMAKRRPVARGRNEASTGQLERLWL